MKRDMELIRKLLFFFDEKADPRPVKVPQIAGFDDLTIRYHVVLLYDAGLIFGEPSKSDTSDRVYDVLPFDLTWAGHEFLDLVRSDTFWEKAKDKTAEEFGAASFAAIKAVVTQHAMNAVAGIAAAI